MCSSDLGNLALQQGMVEEARSLLEEAVLIQRAIGNRFYEGNALNNLGNVERTAGNYPVASSLYTASLSIYRDLEDLWALAYLFEDVGTLAALQGDGWRALALVAAAARLRNAIGSPLKEAEKQRLSLDLQATYESLSRDDQEAAEAAGAKLSLGEAIAYAMGETTN